MKRKGLFAVLLMMILLLGMAPAASAVTPPSLTIDLTGLTEDIGEMYIPDKVTVYLSGTPIDVEINDYKIELPNIGAEVSLDQFKFTSAKENGADKWIFYGWNIVGTDEVVTDSVVVNGIFTIAPELYSNSVLYPTVGIPSDRTNYYQHDVWTGENAIAFKNLGDGSADIKFWYRGVSTTYTPSGFSWRTYGSAYTESANFPTGTETYTVTGDNYPTLYASFTANGIDMETDGSYLAPIASGKLNFLIMGDSSITNGDTFTATITLTSPEGAKVDGTYTVKGASDTTSMEIVNGVGTISNLANYSAVTINDLPGKVNYQLEVTGSEGVTVTLKSDTEAQTTGTITSTSAVVKFTASKPVAGIAFTQGTYTGVLSESLTLEVTPENIPDGAIYAWYLSNYDGKVEYQSTSPSYTIDSLESTHNNCLYKVRVFKTESDVADVSNAIATASYAKVEVLSPTITLDAEKNNLGRYSYSGKLGEALTIPVTVTNMPKGGSVQLSSMSYEEMATATVETDGDGNTVYNLTIDALTEDHNNDVCYVRVLSAASKELDIETIQLEVNIFRSVTLNATSAANTLSDDMVVYKVLLATDKSGTPVTLDKIIVDGEEVSVTNGEFTVTKAHDQQVVISGIPDCTFFTAEVSSSNDSHTYACSSVYYPVELWKDGFGWTYTATCTKEMRTVTFADTKDTTYDSVQVREDKQITLPTNPDAGFSGWQVTTGDSEILGQTYSAGTSVDIKQNTTFTAVWGAAEEKEPYSIVLHDPKTNGTYSGNEGNNITMYADDEAYMLTASYFGTWPKTDDGEDYDYYWKSVAVDGSNPGLYVSGLTPQSSMPLIMMKPGDCTQFTVTINAAADSQGTTIDTTGQVTLNVTYKNENRNDQPNVAGMKVTINGTTYTNGATVSLPNDGEPIAISAEATGTIAGYGITYAVDGDYLTPDNTGTATFTPAGEGEYELTVTAAPNTRSVPTPNGDGSYTATITLSVVDETGSDQPESVGESVLVDPSADGYQPTEFDVTGILKSNDEVNEPAIYCVELTWGDMAFEYRTTTTTTRVWNAENHTWTETTGNPVAGADPWQLISDASLNLQDGAKTIFSDANQSYVVVFNHSNAPVDVAMTNTAADDTHNVTASLNEVEGGVEATTASAAMHTYTLARGIEKTVYNSSTGTAAKITLSGTPDEEISEDAKNPSVIAALTITFSKAD